MQDMNGLESGLTPVDIVSAALHRLSGLFGFSYLFQMIFGSLGKRKGAKIKG
jgi:hypothetical protein